MHRKNIVFWDWNGTLLDDVDVCIEAMNRLLERRGMDLISIERYRDIFDFPVKNYYEKLGFDFDNEPPNTHNANWGKYPPELKDYH